MIDLAKQHPLAQLDGFDISDEQYPPAGWVPKNITLSKLDILKPIPEELRVKYDVVHVSLIVVVVENDDPASVLKNLLTLLSMLFSTCPYTKPEHYNILQVLWQTSSKVS